MEKRFWHDAKAGLIRDVEPAGISKTDKVSVMTPERTDTVELVRNASEYSQVSE